MFDLARVRKKVYRADAEPSLGDYD